MDDYVTIGTIKTPAGAFTALLTPRGLARLAFQVESPEVGAAWARRRLPHARIVRDDRRLIDLADQLTAYFQGQLRTFQLPVDLCGTPFQTQVWRAVQAIAYGEVRTYSDIAALIGRPRAVRAVGAANAANPIPIIVPCHRLIGRDGELRGYAGGLELKRKLLRLEGVGSV